MTTPQADYKVELDSFSGPLDLLLFLIRREEVDIFNIPIARITEQYIRYLDIIGEMNINVAGDFLVMAATLIEIKSRMMTPEPEAAPEEEADDPRMELVRQLMQYKRFKEAAMALTERADVQSARFARPGERLAAAGPQHTEGPAGVNLWALMEAFNRVLEQTGARVPHRLVIDAVPQEQIRAELEDRVRAAGRLGFLEAFKGQVTRSRLIGTFLAILELAKIQAIRAEQDEAFGEIWLTYIPPEERVVEPEHPPEPAAADIAEPAPAIEEPVDTEWPDMELPDVSNLPDEEPAPKPAAVEEDVEDEDEDEDEDDDEDDDDEDDDEDEEDDEDDD